MATTPITATYVSATSFTVSTDRTAEFATGVRTRADCGTDGTFTGVVTASSYASGTDLTTVMLSLDSGALTSNLTGVLHCNDTPASLANHGHTGQADGGKLIQCRAWANFNGTAATIRASENVSSIVNNGSGKYTVNFLNPMADTNYATVGSGLRHVSTSLSIFMIDGDSSGTPTCYTTTAVAITIRDSSDKAADAGYVNIAVFR